MNEQFPQPGDNNYELFRQLEGLDAAIIAEDLEADLDYEQHKVEDVALQRLVVEALRRQDEVPYEVATVVEMFDSDPALEAFSKAIELRFSSDEALQGRDNGSQNHQRMFTYIWKLGSVLGHSFDAKELQAEIIDDVGLAFETKRSLLAVLRESSEKGIIDTEDIDAVHEAIAEFRAKKEHDEQTSVWLQEATQLLRDNEAVLLASYAISPDDPEWRSLRGIASTVIAMRKRSQSTGEYVPSPYAFDADSHLHALRLPEGEFEQFINAMYSLLED